MGNFEKNGSFLGSNVSYLGSYVKPLKVGDLGAGHLRAVAWCTLVLRDTSIHNYDSYAIEQEQLLLPRPLTVIGRERAAMASKTRRLFAAINLTYNCVWFVWLPVQSTYSLNTLNRWTTPSCSPNAHLPIQLKKPMHGIESVFLLPKRRRKAPHKLALVHVFEKKVIIPECRSTNQAVTFCERKVVMTAFEKVTKTSITRDISFKIKLMCFHMILLHSVIQVSEDGWHYFKNDSRVLMLRVSACA